MRGATKPWLFSVVAIAVVSTHAPHAGSDGDYFEYEFGLNEFQPTLPMRGATLKRDPLWFNVVVSTHAPHAGSDSCVTTYKTA